MMTCRLHSREHLPAVDIRRLPDSSVVLELGADTNEIIVFLKDLDAVRRLTEDILAKCEKVKCP